MPRISGLFPGVCLLLAAPLAAAAELAGVQLDDRIEARDGTVLELHGAGVREKFFFDIYVGALYLPETGQSLERIRGTDQAGRIEMHFVYDGVSRKKLAAAWRDGFDDNNPPEVRDTIADRVGTFIGLFPDATEGDRCTMEYIPGHGTEVRFNGERMATIEGGIFFRALLAVWLGPNPPGEGLKRGLLGE